MANTIALKRRITSVKNTRQITKAMELVAASKMRRAQENAQMTREYSVLAGSILTRLRELTDVSKHPLYKKRPNIKIRLHVVITSDRGLAGAYNSNVLRNLAKALKADEQDKVASQVVVVGKQAAQFISRFKNIEVIAVYKDFPEKPTEVDIRPVLDQLVSAYIKRRADAVDLIYTDFKSSVSQEVTAHRLLPAAFHAEPGGANLAHADFEPSPEAVLEKITIRLIEAQLMQAFLESQASEQSMRMMAMKSATDNATELAEDLTLAFNTARQAAITQELAEITGGAEAIK